MNKIKNANFFKKPLPTAPQNGPTAQQPQQTPAPQAPQPAAAQQAQPQPPRIIHISSELLDEVKKTIALLKEQELPVHAKQVAQLCGNVLNERFAIAVVGEFSKGKSTLINRLVNAEVLPTSVLPTTALLTRIRYGAQPKLTAVNKSGQRRAMPLQPQSWEGLTATNFGDREPEGFVEVELPNTWLGQNNIEVIDTPGAGDLEASRAAVIERCLMGAEACVVVMAATKLLSITEREFIRKKLLSRNIPFMAIALTHMDQVPAEERVNVIDYLYKQLEGMKLKVPVFVADDDVHLPGSVYDDICGFDCLRKMVASWMIHPERRELTEQWLKTNVADVLGNALATLQQQQAFLQAKDSEREQLIARRNNALAQIDSKWKELRDEMETRCNRCIQQFNTRAAECGDTIIETLQHEVGRQPNPKQWVDEEYAYRVKRELSAVSLALDQRVAHSLNVDLKWLNEQISRQFQMVLNIRPDDLNSKEELQPDVNERAVRLQDIKDQSTKATILTTCATLGTALMLGVSGAAPLILATMGVGTGANLLSRRMLDKKAKEQQQKIKELIATEVKRIMQEASADSEVKIRLLYNDIIRQSRNVENRWMQAQRDLIRQTTEGNVDEARQKVKGRIEALTQACETLHNA